MDLEAAGLSTKSCFTMLQTYAQGCVTHFQRGNYEATGWPGMVDNVVMGTLDNLLECSTTELQRTVASLRLSEGGMGMPLAAVRAAPAYLGSWALAMRTVAEVVEAHSWESFVAKCPAIHEALRAAENAAVAAGDGHVVRPDWIACFQEPKPKLQGEISKHISAANRECVLRQLPEDERSLFRSNGGKGAGAFSLPPEGEEVPVMPDKHFQVVVRDRLGCPVSPAGARCQHRRTDGSLCNAPLDRRGMHARICPIGGALIRKHNNVRDWAGKEHQARSGYTTEYEQRIPEWDATVTQEDGSETVEQAILDFVSRDALTGRQIHVDATVVCAFSTNTAQLRSRANKDGLATSQAANGKRSRYTVWQMGL